LPSSVSPLVRPLVVVDAAHLYAAAARSLGLGAARRPGRFDPVVLVDLVLSLLPEAERAAEVVWLDGVRPGARSPELDRLRADERVRLQLVPVRAGRQRHVEALVVAEVLSAGHRSAAVLLVGDPRRHAVALDLAAEAGIALRLVGTADGETSPAPRLWLRRGQLGPALLDRRPARRVAGGDYQRPGLVTSPVRLPGR
jgi:hypothetical protein